MPALSAAISFIFMPESPKFLMEVGRNEEALHVFQTIYKRNNPTSKCKYPVSDLYEHSNIRVPVQSRNAWKKSLNTVKQVCRSMSLLFTPPLTSITIIKLIVYFTWFVNDGSCLLMSKTQL